MAPRRPGTADHAAVQRRLPRGLLAEQGDALSKPSAPTGSRTAARSSSRGSRATSSPSWACRSWSCSASCAPAGWWRMTAAPPLAGVIGWPIGHSRSPRLHGHWLARYRIDGYYVPIALPPEGFAAGLLRLPALGFRGVNVTIPHKEAALALATEATDRARGDRRRQHPHLRPGRRDPRRQHRRLRLHRQPAAGGAEAGAPPPGPALVLGAGGSARAVVAALLAEGLPEVRVASRTRARAEALRDHFGPRLVAPIGLEATAAAADGRDHRQRHLARHGGREPRCRSTSRACPGGARHRHRLRRRADAVRPRRARLGLTAVDGLGMLLHQGVPGFERWFGRRPGGRRRAARRGAGAVRPYRLGLTGSIGMGKSTTAGSSPRPASRSGTPTPPCTGSMPPAAPGAAARRPRAGCREAGAVDRDRLRDAILADPGLLARIEARVHPLVAADRRGLSRGGHADADIVLSTSRCSSRPAARSRSTACWWSAPRPRCSARGYWRGRA